MILVADQFQATFDISTWLGTDTISAVAYSAVDNDGNDASADVLDAASHDNTSTVIKPYIKGGADGVVYTVKMLVTTAGGDAQTFSARAVVNNTDPLSNNTSVNENTPVGDPDLWHNKVSFMGADVITTGSEASGYSGDCGIVSSDWASGMRGPGVKKFNSLIGGISDAAACSAAGGEWQAHAFSGYAFILRADAERFIDYFDEDVYGPDPMNAVPVPPAVWLFSSGLLCLFGFIRRK